MQKVNIPTFDMFMNPVIQALKELGGSGTIEEINSKVIEITRLSDEQLEVLHNPDKGGQTEVEYRLAWTRTYLKKVGLLENSSRGVWALTGEGRELEEVNPKTIKRFVRQQHQEARESSNENIEDESVEELTWREELMNVILEMSDAAFEDLSARVLREAGFVQVEVTGRSGDGGIDGRGVMRLGGFISFHVYFQCKKYKGSVGAREVRDFRGAMEGRADKGLFITAGKFTESAKAEALRDGAKPIDLIDGEQFINKLKDLSLGVKTEKVEIEKITIDPDWFKAFEYR